MALRNLGVLAVVCGLAIPVMGQVAPPPTEAPPKTPEYTPPEAPAPAPAPATPAVKPDRKVGVDPNKEKSAEMVVDQRRQGKLELPEGFNSTLLVVRDENGKLVRYDRPLAWIAYERNPMITPERRQELAPAMRRRVIMYEIAMVNNLDLIMKVDQGEFDSLDYRDRRTIAWAERVKRQLRPGGMLSEWLYSQGYVTAEEAAGCQELANKYAQAALVEARDAAGDDRIEQTLAFTRYFYKSQVDESLYVYRQLIQRTAGRIQECVDKAELPADIYAGIQPQIEAVKAAKTDDEKRATMTALLEAIPDWVVQHRLIDQAITLEYPDRSTKVGEHTVIPVMAYQVETAHRKEKAAKGEQVQYQKEPPRPAR
ncbi:MAG: hypothetical protein GIKADHBN_02303 [Phycisphaerales bacterium]|nr:hypothetical protein [Phycisphaerales bacterium]MCK6476287.1 hypothetical protein [Phycisphaerales bacterium]